MTGSEQQPPEGKSQVTTQSEDDEPKTYASALDKALEVKGQYILGLTCGTVINFVSAQRPRPSNGLEGWTVHLDTDQTQAPRVSPIPRVGLPFKGGVDVNASQIVWVAEQAHIGG